MRSRLLSALDSNIAATSEAFKPQLRAERVAYLARAGKVNEASDELASLRSEYSAVRDSRLSALLNFAEGLCHYYRDFSPAAADRFRRARALAEIGGHTDVGGRALSWLSLLAYLDHKYEDMRRYIDECVCDLRCKDSTALARTSLTIAMAGHMGNRFDLAMPWYRRTHLFAVEMQDEAMISAMLHNMASLWLTNARNASLGGPATKDRSRQALMGALSSFNFDELVEFSALGVLQPLLEAQLCSIEADFAGAVRLYDRSEQDFQVQSVHNWATWMVADRLWCQLKCGIDAGASQTLDSITLSLKSVAHPDERGATLARLAACWQILGQPKRAQDCLEQAEACWQQFGVIQQNMLQAAINSDGARLLAETRPI